MEMISELACSSNVVHEPLRLFSKKLQHTVGIDAGIGRSITLQAIENGVAYDVKSYDQGSRVKIIAEFARWDVELHETMSDEVVAAADSFMQLPELQRFRDEGPKRGVIARALLNWASGKRDDQQSSHVVHTEAVGVSSSNIRDALKARHQGVGGGTLRYDSNYTKAELKLGAREYSIELKECIQLALEGKLVHCLLNFWGKYFTWNQLVHMITAVHLEVEGTSSLNVGFKMIAEVFKSPSATNWNQLPGELVYFGLNLPGGGSVLTCVNKSFCSAADATNKIDDRTALFTALAQEFVASTLSEMRGETVTHHKCIQAVHEKLKVQDDLHLGKMIAAAFSRYSVSNVDSFLTCGSGRSKFWTRRARQQAYWTERARRHDVSMSHVNLKGGSSVSWYGMIALTQGVTLPKNFGSLAIFCAESTNPALCWKKVSTDMYGCEWYSILSRIAEFAYNIRLPSDEIQQARLVKRKSVYEENLSLTRATTLTKQEKKRVTLVVPFEVQPVPQEPNAFKEWHRRQKSIWREMREKRRVLRLASTILTKVVSKEPEAFQQWLGERKEFWKSSCRKRKAVDQTVESNQPITYNASLPEKKAKDTTVSTSSVVQASSRLSKRQKKTTSDKKRSIEDEGAKSVHKRKRQRTDPSAKSEKQLDLETQGVEIPPSIDFVKNSSGERLRVRVTVANNKVSIGERWRVTKEGLEAAIIALTIAEKYITDNKITASNKTERIKEMKKTVNSSQELKQAEKSMKDAEKKARMEYALAHFNATFKLIL